jgi:hypothetical protein
MTFMNLRKAPFCSKFNLAKKGKPAVLRIRIRRIHTGMFLGLPDPHPDPLDIWIRIRTFYHQAKIVLKTLIPTVFLLFWTYYQPSTSNNKKIVLTS